MSPRILVPFLIALVVGSCQSRDLDLVSGTVANVDLVRQCNELRLAKDEILPVLAVLEDAELDRLEEINAVHKIICTADLRALIAEVREMKEGAR